MPFLKAIIMCLKKYFVFSGRAGRLEFWSFSLFSSILSLIIPIAGLLLLMPQLAVGSRRLHDIDKSGWCQLIVMLTYFFIGFILILGYQIKNEALGLMILIVSVILGLSSIIILCYWFAKKGNPQKNRYGTP